MNFYKYIIAQFVKGEKQFFKNFLGGHIMAKIIKKSFDNKVTPKGLAKWVKVNSRYDEYEGKKKYSVTLRFPNKDDEARMKKFCDDTLAAAKKLAEFEGRTWRSGDDLRNGYSVAQDGSLEFKFQTGAFYTDRETGEKMQKFIPVFNVATQSKLPHDVGEQRSHGAVYERVDDDVPPLRALIRPGIDALVQLRQVRASRIARRLNLGEHDRIVLAAQLKLV